MKFVQDDIQSVEIVNLKKGGKVVITLKDDTFQPYVTFSSKKELKAYYDWITCNPKHPIHEMNQLINNKK